MNRTQKRQILSKYEGLSPFQKLERYTFEARLNLVGPLSEVEVGAARRALASLGSQTAFFHGGASGFRVGSDLLPAGKTGADPKSVGKSYAPRLESLFVSTCFETAKGYASLLSEGSVYRVEPEKPLGCDPVYLRAAMLCEADESLRDHIGFADVAHAFTCPSALVLEVLA